MNNRIEKEFIERKKNTLSKLKKAIIKDLVDKDIIPTLNLINSHEDYYTSSSCFGRIIILEIPKIGDKKKARFLGKWHKKISINDIKLAIRKAKKGQIWLLAQPSIIHVIVRNLKAADKILKIAISSSFKNSAFKSISKKIVVEIISTERIDFPLGENGKIFCNNNHLKLIIKISNEIINKSIKKLKILNKKLNNFNI
jgi:tRNA wybutosine-synthesizing protein 3